MKVRCDIRFNDKNLPKKGVYVSNHVSYLDPLLLFAYLPGDPIFALNGHLYRNKWIRAFMKTADIMPFNPIEPGDIKELIAKVDSGRCCVIFAEGRITENGGLMKIYEAPGLVADKSKAPIIPVWINGPQYGYFSKTKGKLPHRPLPKINITVKAPVNFKLKDELRRQRDHISNEVYVLMRDLCFEASYNDNISLFAQLMKTAKVHSKKGFLRRPRFVEDINRVPNSYKDIIIKSYVLGKYFKRRTAPGEHVALLLPNSIATLCAFFGLSAYGRIPVMLNFSVGAANMVSMCKTAVVKKVITSHLFIRNAKMESVIEEIKKAGFDVIFLEDLRRQIGLWEKINAFLRYKIKRVPSKEGGNKKAVILFTSGSEGAPKAVVLSHANILSNIRQISSIETLNMTDTVFNALPMFHSFGLTVGTLFPLLEGAKLFLYPSPLHYRVISEIVYEIGASVMFGTDTFFRGYAKIAHPIDFHNIRFMFGGAEAIKPDTRNMWVERQGIRVMEAYGSTECSPVVTANNRIFNRFGSIGKLLPKVEYKIEHVDGIETSGELVVKGPNVMMGYIMPDNPGVLVPLKDGWYHTGDVVDIDEIGFVYIKDRIKRFAKIGGEMVSLNAVSEMVVRAHEADGPEHMYGVVAVPHESKGEQIVLVTNNRNVTQSTLHNFIRLNGMSELYLPRVILYHDSLPVFATGKADNVTLKKQVMEELGLTSINKSC
ncbi:MAG: acyl-[ACP]--phospholipid O-acyltransferase [Alphaproteobacteria bacterium]|nr:acyl-[ACP]--phospholipid O-acyltransferase [Alphaproteobacteria bacterium]